jgi:hypothetical protein
LDQGEVAAPRRQSAYWRSLTGEKIVQPIKMFAAAAVLVIAAGLITGAGAQQQPGQTSEIGHGMMGAGGMGRWMMGSGGSTQDMCSAMAGHIEGRLAYIKAELKITEPQEPLWKTYAAAARENANTMLSHCTAMTGQPGTTTSSLPDRLDQHEKLMADQLEAVRAMNKALKPLYAALGDSQKKTAEELFWGHMGMMM